MKVAIQNSKFNYSYQFTTNTSGIIGVYGISGSGKSSLLDALAGYDDNMIGTIEFNGKSRSGITQSCYMNQSPILFEHWTIEQNLNFVKKYHNQPYDELLKLLECEHLLTAYPRQLSGGEKQRITLIRTLVQIKKNSLVLLDEPFSALDISIRKKALNLLSQNKNCLIFLVTHEISELYQVADEILYIKNNAIALHENSEICMASGFENLPIASKLILENKHHIIYADNVSISLMVNNKSSIQHQLPVKITTIKITKKGVLLVLEYDSKIKQHLYAQITLDSFNKLKLEKTQRVIANFKALSYHD